MAKAKGTKMSLAAFNQKDGEDSSWDALPTAPRQRDAASATAGEDRRQKVDGGNWVRGDKFQAFDENERGGGGRGRGGYGRNRGGDDEEQNGGRGGDAANSRADDANQWRRSGGDDRRSGGFGGRDRDDDSSRRSYGRGRDDDSKGSEGGSSSNDWRRSGPPSDDRDRFSGGGRRNFEDRDRMGGGRDRDRRDDRDDRFRRGGDDDRFSRREDRGDRDDRFNRRGGDDRYGGDRDRDNRRGGDDRYGGDRDRDGGRYGGGRNGDRDRDRYGRGESDDRPAHLRFGRSRAEASNEPLVDDFPLPSSSAANRTEASEKAAAGPKVTVKTAKKPASTEETEKADAGESSAPKKKSNKKNIAPLEAALKGGVISDSQFTASMDWLVEEKARLDDAEERRELVYAIAASLMDKKLSLSTVIASLEKSLPDAVASFVLELLKAIRTRKDESVALALVKAADQSKVLSLISNDKEGAALESFLNENDLSILIPVPDLSESVEKALQNKESADAIVKLIDNAVDKKAAVSYLLPLVSKHLIALLFADKPKHNISVLTAWAPLLARVTLHDKLAKVSLLFTVCNAWFTETKAAKGVIRELFETLLNSKVVHIDSLIDWRDSKEKSPSKPKALLQVSTWISEIEPKREEPEEEEGEEGDDDELLTNPNQQD